MALYSPGVEIKEIDLTNVVPALATSVGGYAGSFNWGPAGELVTVSSEKDLATIFGAPNNSTTSTTASFFTAASFLKYGNNLRVSRSLETGDVNAASKFLSAPTVYTDAVPRQIANKDVYDAITATQDILKSAIVARCAGLIGNNLKVILCRAKALESATSTRGLGYTVGTGIATTSTTGRSGCTLAITAIDSKGAITALASAPTEPGTGYAVGDILTITGGTAGNLATAKVKTITGSAATGPVESVTFVNLADERVDASLFSYVPGISTYATNVVKANSTSANEATNLANAQDEIHIAIIDADGSFTGTAGTVLEKWEGLSLFTDAKTENGAANYYRDVVNRNSRYIYINKLKDCRVTTDTTGIVETEFAVTDVTAISALTTSLGVKPNTGGIIIELKGGANVEMTPSGMSDAYNLFVNSDTVDVNLLFGEVHETTATATTNDIKLSTLVNDRKDCIGFMSAPMEITRQTSDTDKKLSINAKLAIQNCPANSYMVMDSSPVYIYNKYTDKYIWIPACGHVAGLCANTDAVADAWFSPAGFNRGQLQDVVKLAYNPNQAHRDDLYKVGVNPICSFPGQGVVLYGDKTRLAKPSAFDRINVRRLFITLEKAVATASKFQLFEQNDDFTRAAFKNMVEPYLRDVKGRRGITDFRVVCDTTNNTGEVIDTNRFIADIYIKPTRSINFITLNFIATRTGVEFSEIVG